MIAAEKPIRLRDLAHARSGDKGNSVNIGVVAKSQSAFAKLRVHLTEEVVSAYLSPLRIGKVRRYELPHLLAFNFVIEQALAGGASRSLRLDSQGKALGMAILELRLPVPGGDLAGENKETPT